MSMKRFHETELWPQIGGCVTQIGDYVTQIGGCVTQTGGCVTQISLRFSGHSHRMLRSKKVQCHSPTLSLSSLSAEVAGRLADGFEMEATLLYGA